MRRRYSNQTIAGVASTALLFLLFFVFQLGLPSVFVAILVFFGILLYLPAPPPKTQEPEERKYTLDDLDAAIFQLEKWSVTLPKSTAKKVDEIIIYGHKVHFHLLEKPSYASECLFQVISTLDGVYLALEQFRPLANSVEGEEDPAVVLLNNYLQSSIHVLRVANQELRQKDRDALQKRIDTLYHQQSALDEIDQTLGKEEPH